MTQTREVPEPWATAMMDKGYSWAGRPSISSLARAMDVSVEATRRMVLGMGNPSPETVSIASKALRTDVSRWVGQPTAGERYVGPDSSRRLTERQRQAITDLIQSMVGTSPTDPE